MCRHGSRELAHYMPIVRDSYFSMGLFLSPLAGGLYALATLGRRHAVGLYATRSGSRLRVSSAASLRSMRPRALCAAHLCAHAAGLLAFHALRYAPRAAMRSACMPRAPVLGSVCPRPLRFAQCVLGHSAPLTSAHSAGGPPPSRPAADSIRLPWYSSTRTFCRF